MVEGTSNQGPDKGGGGVFCIPQLATVAARTIRTIFHSFILFIC